MQTGDLPDQTANVAAATLTGDLRDVLLGQAKRNTKPWDQRSEREQQTFIDACTRTAEDAARKAVTAVAARGFESVEFQFGSIQYKDGSIVAQVKCAGSRENILAMFNGGKAMIVFASPREFFGERAPARVTPDQPDLMDELKDGEAVAADGEAQAAAATSAQRAPADTLAADQQREALGSAGGTAGGTAAGSPAEPLGEQAQINADRLAGIKPLAAAGADPIEDGAPAPKKRGRRSAAERVAAATKATTPIERRVG